MTSWRDMAPFSYTHTFPTTGTGDSGFASAGTTGVRTADRVAQSVGTGYSQQTSNLLPFVPRPEFAGALLAADYDKFGNVTNYREWAARQSILSIGTALTAALASYNTLHALDPTKAEWEFWGNPDGTLAQAGVSGEITIGFTWQRLGTAFTIDSTSGDETFVAGPSLDGLPSASVTFSLKQIDDSVSLADGPGLIDPIANIYLGVAAYTDSTTGHTEEQHGPQLLEAALPSASVLDTFDWSAGPTIGNVGSDQPFGAPIYYYSGTDTRSVTVSSADFAVESPPDTPDQPTIPVVGLAVDASVHAIDPPAMQHLWGLLAVVNVTAVTFDLQPPRSRLLAAPPLRQFPRDDFIGGSPRQDRSTTSTNATARQGYTNTYR